MAVPIITVTQMREWESASWLAGCQEQAVMQQAGEAVARTALAMTRSNDAVLVLAGRGHNGDDARFATEFLPGRAVRLLNLSDPAAPLNELRAALSGRPALLIDGLFGIGLNRPLNTDWLEVIRLLNETGVPILAVDVPSGLNADTGTPLPEALCATITLTFGAPKRGMITTEAARWIGRLEVAPEIGLTACPITSELNWTLPGDFHGFPPRRTVASHKGSHGHAVVIAGSAGYHGAAVLAARGAQRAQPGLVTLFTDPSVYVPVAAQLQAVMVQSWNPNVTLPESCTALLLGPGMAARDLNGSVREFLRSAWNHATVPMVVDASALEWIAHGTRASAAPRVITPHPGEAARLLGVTSQEVQADRPGATRALSDRFGNCWVALKGHQTILGQEIGPLFVNSSGNPQLAQGGSGDLLAGYVTGLLAQPMLQENLPLTLRWAVWEHGAAADRLTATRRNWVIEELAGELGRGSRAES